MAENKLTLIIDSEQQADDSKTAAFPRRRPRRLGRRRLSGGIRFYDLGQILSGASYIDLPYVDADRSMPVTDSLGGSGSTAPFIPISISSSHYTDLEDLVFEVPLEEWKQNYRLIDSDYDNSPLGGATISVNYRGTSYDLSDFPDGKLKASGDTNNAFIVSCTLNQELFQGIHTTFNKITSVRDYSASAVAFVPSPNMDVFWMPEIVQPQITTDYLYIVSSVVTERHLDLLCSHTITWPRRETIDPTYDYFEFRYVNGSRTINPSWQDFGAPSDPDDYTRFYNGVRMIQEEQPHFARRYEYPGWSASSISTSTFMSDATLWVTPPSTPPKTYSQTSTLVGFSPLRTSVSGSLIAVIKNQGQYYYFWN